MYKRFVVLCLISVSCNSEPESERLARRYCTCMIANNATKDFFIAEKVCNVELLKNRYLRIEMTNMRDRESNKKIPDQTRDSTLQFLRSFSTYVNSHCCKEIGLCMDSTATSSIEKTINCLLSPHVCDELFRTRSIYLR